MRYRNLVELEAKCNEEVAYRIDVVCFTNEAHDDGTESCLDSEFWHDELHDVWWHPFECCFDSLDEALAWCKCFNKHVAMWTHTHGNGNEFDHVSIEIIEMWRGVKKHEYVPSAAIAVFDWMWGHELDTWFYEEVADERQPE